MHTPPPSGSSLISNSTSMSSSLSSSYASSSPNSHFPSTPPRSPSPSPRFFSTSPTSSYQGRRLSNSQPTWAYLSSILSSILLPSTNDNTTHRLRSKKKKKQVDIGLFAKSSDLEFIRIKELMLNGMEVDCGVDDDHSTSGGGNNQEEGCNDVKGSFANTTDDDGLCGKGKGRGGEIGAVRVYQLGLKSQKSFERLCGPMLRSFESSCH